MKRYIIILIVLLSLASCTKHSEHWETLAQVESYIEERPDSALVVLQGIDNEELANDEERAKHALLLSMALDKNYIDKTDFEVLQPAIDYYEDNGSATDKLRTCYYQGRIYQNAGYDAAAMTCYINALEVGDDSNDILTKARLYVAQGNIYSSLLKWDEYIDVNMQAAEYFHQMNRTDSYVNCLIKVCNGHIQNDDNAKAAEVLNKCSDYRNDISNRILGKCYSALITYQCVSGKNEDIVLTIEEYFNEVGEDSIDYLTVANGYLTVGEFDKALEAIIDRDYSNNQNQELRYYATLGEIYLSQERYNEALSAYLKYYELHDPIVYSIFESDTQFIEERHALEMAKAKETEAKNKRTIAIMACVIALIGSILVILIIRRRLQISRAENKELEVERQKYEQLYADAVAERDALTKMVEDSSVKEEAKSVIKTRLDVLNKVIISQITGTISANKKAYEELEALVANRDSFIESTRLTIEGNNPKFVTTLKQRGLTDEEINICCLYAIGLKGKDIKAYTSQPRHYHHSADIRHKLGLTESDTNLSIFLKEMLEK